MKLSKEARERVIKEALEAMLDDIIYRYFYPDYVDDDLLDEVLHDLLVEEGLDPEEEEDVFYKEKDEIKEEVYKRMTGSLPE